LYSAIALLASGVLAMTLTGKAPWSGIARSPLLQSIGRVSYGGYVYHIVCITWVRQALKLVVHPAAGMAGKLEFGGLTFGLVLPLTIAAAMLSYRYIERPIIVYFARRA
jgi:peptidoglycan/LPS O-acetylase OafA/YrhL